MKLNDEIFYNYGYVLYNLYSFYGKPTVVEQKLKEYIGEAKYGYFKEDYEFNSMYSNLVKRFNNQETFPVSMIWHIKDHASREERSYCITSIENFYDLCKRYYPNNEVASVMMPRILLNLK